MLSSACCRRGRASIGSSATIRQCELVPSSEDPDGAPQVSAGRVDRHRGRETICLGHPSDSSLLNHVNRLDSLQCPPGCCKGLIPSGQPYAFFRNPVVLLHYIIEILAQTQSTPPTQVSLRNPGACSEPSASVSHNAVSGPPSPRSAGRHDLPGSWTMRPAFQFEIIRQR